jgi:hypothetical protein
MVTISCADLRMQIEIGLEEERSPEADSHLSQCKSCSVLVRDLNAIRMAAASLSEVEPPTILWARIRSQLEKENLIHSRRPWWGGLFGWSGSLRPALAGAYLAFLIAASVSFVWHDNVSRGAELHATWLRHTESVTAPFRTRLNFVESKGTTIARADNPDVTATLNRNLAIVDNMISMCEKSVREDPQNEMTRDYLYSAYQQKADLLASMAESGTEGR